MLNTQRPRQVAGYQVADRESLSGELVLFHPEREQILYSNPTGALIWGLCDGRQTVADIVRLLSDSYPDASPAIAADVEEALAAFDRHGAIEWV